MDGVVGTDVDGFAGHAKQKADDAHAHVHVNNHVYARGPDSLIEPHQ